MCIKNIIRSKKIVEVFIDSWCNYCKNQLDQNNLESFLKIFLKLLRIEKRNEKLNDLIKIFFSKFNFSEILNSTRKDERLLLQVAFSQYKFQTGNFLESEKIASKNIEDAKDLIKNETTNDLGWLLVKRSVSLFRNKKIGRDNLDNLLKSLR